MNIELALEDFSYYSKHMRGVSDNTLKRYKSTIMLFHRDMEIFHIKNITKKIVQEFFLHGRADRKWSVQTYRTHAMTLIVFFRWCIKNDLMKENYAKEIELPRLERSLPKRIKKKDAFLILDTVYNYPYVQKYQRDRNHAIFSMFLHAGLRKHELLNLKVSDVDIETMTLFIRQGKGNRDRVVPIGTTLAKSLIRYSFSRKKAAKTCPEYFTSSNKNNGFTNSGLKRIVDKIKKSTGIYFTIHGLRHTFATLMIEGGCDIYSLSRMMGHSDIKTTTIYLSATAEHLRGQMIKHPLNL